MKHLPTKNTKSNYAASGLHYAEAAELSVPEEVIDPIQRFQMEIERHKVIDKHLSRQVTIYGYSLKMRQMDQVDKLHNIKTEFRSPEIIGWDSIEENKKGE